MLRVTWYSVRCRVNSLSNRFSPRQTLVSDLGRKHNKFNYVRGSFGVLRLKLLLLPPFKEQNEQKTSPKVLQL